MIEETVVVEITPRNPDRHKDVFTSCEAAAYLGFESTRSLETMR